MKRCGWILMIALTLLTPLAAQSLEVELQRAIQRETATGDVKKSIAEYQSILERATRPPRDRAVAAKALLRIAECYQIQGQMEARRWYEQLINEYSDLPQAAVARAALNRAPVAPSTRTAYRAVWTVADGGDVYGKISPNGRFVPYTNWKESGDLYLHDFQSNTDRRLTTAASKAVRAGDEWGESAAFSRDSRELAFAWGKGERGQLRIVNVDSPGIPQPRVLVDNPEIKWVWPEDWTRDGKKIVAGVQRADGTAQIALISATDGTITVLKSLDWRGMMRMALSPDGEYLAYDLRGRETNARDVHLLKMDATRESDVVTHPSNDMLLGWSADGTQVLFISDRAGAHGVWSVSIASGRPHGNAQLLRPDVGRILPIGLTSAGGLYTRSLYTTTWGGAAGADIKLAKFDFKKGVFASSPEDLDQSDGMSALDPRWSRDGKLLAFTVHRGVRLTSDLAIRVRSLETGAIVQELRPKLSNFGFVWTPQDDGFLAVGEDFKGRQGMYRIDGTTGEVTPYVLAQAGEQIFLPIFDRRTANPDKLYYRRYSGQESVLIARSVQTGSEREVARGLQLGISVERQKTYARRMDANKEGVIIERDLASGAEREVFRHKNLTGFVASVARPAMFADSGRFIAVLTEPASKTVTWLSVSVNGGDTPELIRATPPESVAMFTISPDGSAVFVRRNWGSGSDLVSELVRLPLDGSRPTPVVLQDMDIRNLPGVAGFSIHPDGEQVAFVVERGRAQIPYEVWVLENFLPSGNSR